MSQKSTWHCTQHPHTSPWRGHRHTGHPPLSPPAQPRGKLWETPSAPVPVVSALQTAAAQLAGNRTMGSGHWSQPLLPPFPTACLIARSRKTPETNTQILQTDARGKETNSELFNNVEREILIAAFPKTTPLLPSPSLEKASQFCFYISHPQGRTIPTSPCAHLHHQPCLNISKSHKLRLPRKRTALPSKHTPVTKII